VSSGEVFCSDGQDGDQDGLVDCVDPDCVDDPICVSEEDCDVPGDEDGNGVADCEDPACGVCTDSPRPNCAPPPDTEFVCDNGFDGDCDGLVDCEDPDCTEDISCLLEEDCSTVQDEDGDGLAGCADDECCSPVVGGFVSPRCSCPQEDCSDGEDNNFDGLADCDDPVCADVCVELLEVCDDGIDNDLDGFADCADSDCAVACECAFACVCLGNCTQFLRGDANGDARVDIADAVWTVRAVFSPIGDTGCQDASDANDDDLVDVSDAVFLIAYQFRGGAQPPAPFPECGVSPDSSPLSCLELPSACSG
jgi:hypothetical protein